MNEELKNAYEQYANKGFILQKSFKHTKHAYREGAYKDRVNESWDEKATGYVAIIPKSIIIVDNDSYKDNGESFKRLLKDLKLDYTPKPFCKTPSGGEHYAFENPNEDMVIGCLDYEALDIYAGYQSVIPIVGTTVYNKKGDLATYQWATDDGFILNKYSDNMREVFKMRNRNDTSSNDYDETGLTLAIKEDDMPLSEVKELCSVIPIENYRYDTGYLKFCMAMYDRFEGSKEGLELLQETCSRSPINDFETNRKKWENHNLKPSRGITWRTLRSLANDSIKNTIEKMIEECENDNDFKEVIRFIKSQKKLNNQTQSDDLARQTLSTSINSKMKDLRKEGKSINLIQARTILPMLSPAPSSESSKNAKIYLNGNDYIIIVDNILTSDLKETSMVKHLMCKGFDKDAISTLLTKITPISQFFTRTNYLLQTPTKYTLEQRNDNRDMVLIEEVNPLFKAPNRIHDNEVIKDFMSDIWNGKCEDITRLIALTIKFRETKLNRLMLIAPSNSGKSELFKMLNFQSIMKQPLIKAMRGEKGIGRQVIEGLKSSGLLLIDEANTQLESDIKNMDGDVNIDQFGSGGTQVIPLHFTALTSTHSGAISTNSDELCNRFLKVELVPSEMKYTVTDSPIYIKDTAHYSNVIKSHLINLFRDTLLGDESYEVLKELQEKYRLTMEDSDINDILVDAMNAFIEDTKNQAEFNGERVVCKLDKYYFKKKSDVKSFFKSYLSEHKELDINKYAELLATHVLGEGKRVSLRLSKEILSVYEASLLPFHMDSHDRVCAMFDSLDDL